MNKNFEHRIILFAKRHNLVLEWQALNFGYARAKIHCGSREELSAVETALRRQPNRVVVTNVWSCAAGKFEGYVFAMEPQDKADYDAKTKAEQKRLENWWQRYHSADTETRSLMACGVLT